jgi:hypothetical protein
MRTREELFDIWAAEEGTWSPWVKPVLFSQLNDIDLLGPDTEDNFEWTGADVPDSGSATALIIDLPGERGLRIAGALAGRGYRPVPLFNGVPHPQGGFVPVAAIARELVTLADDVERAALSPAAPPAFVLDAGRMAGGRVPDPGQFDNRWMVFPQDFPSASFLAAHGVQRVIVIQQDAAVAEDLARVLIPYRRQGIEVLTMSPASGSRPETAVLAETSWMKTVLFRAMVLLRLRRNSAGGFGAMVPAARRTGFYG